MEYELNRINGYDTYKRFEIIEIQDRKVPRPFVVDFTDQFRCTCDQMRTENNVPPGSLLVTYCPHINFLWETLSSWQLGRLAEMLEATNKRIYVMDFMEKLQKAANLYKAGVRKAEKDFVQREYGWQGILKYARKRAIADWVKEGKMDDPFEKPSEKPKLSIVVENAPIMKKKLYEFYKQLVDDLESKKVFSTAISTAASSAMSTALTMDDMQKAISAIKMQDLKRKLPIDIDTGMEQDRSATITIKNSTGKTIEWERPVYFRDEDIQEIIQHPETKKQPKKPSPPRNIFTEFEL